MAPWAILESRVGQRDCLSVQFLEIEVVMFSGEKVTVFREVEKGVAIESGKRYCSVDSFCFLFARFTMLEVNFGTVLLTSVWCREKELTSILIVFLTNRHIGTFALFHQHFL
jgi:hypothetical protein